MTVIRGWSDGWDEYNSLSPPAEIIMNNWVKNIHDLVYLPVQLLKALPVLEFEDRTRSRIEPSQADLIAYANPEGWRKRPPAIEDWQRNELNYFRAIKNMHRAFGWRIRFQREEFLIAVADFQEKVLDHDKRLKRSNPRAFWPVPDVTLPPKRWRCEGKKMTFARDSQYHWAIGRLES